MLHKVSSSYELPFSYSFFSYELTQSEKYNIILTQ